VNGFYCATSGPIQCCKRIVFPNDRCDLAPGDPIKVSDPSDYWRTIMDTKFKTRKWRFAQGLPLLATAAMLLTLTQAASAHDDDEGGWYQPRVHDWHSGWHHDWHSGPHVGWHSGLHWDPYYGWHYGEHYGPHSGRHHDWHYGPHHDWYGGDSDD
jgi:hypothetical protein